MEPIRALFLNCTLKPTPAESNTAALIEKVRGLMERQGGVTAEVVRPVDFRMLPGVESDLGEGDEWPGILERVRACDILVLCSPIWVGAMSSVCQQVIERLDGTYNEWDEATGQYPLYNKVGAAIVTGNEDGAQAVAAHILFALESFGCTIPPNSDVYWVGDAGAGPSYIEAHADKHFYTNKIAAWTAYNTVWMARLLRDHPCPTNLTELSEEQMRYSATPKGDPHAIAHERDRLTEGAKR